VVGIAVVAVAVLMVVLIVVGEAVGDGLRLDAQPVNTSAADRINANEPEVLRMRACSPRA
jgi:hypothetical protein